MSLSHPAAPSKSQPKGQADEVSAIGIACTTLTISGTMVVPTEQGCSIYMWENKKTPFEDCGQSANCQRSFATSDKLELELEV